MASLNANKALLDMARQGTELLQSPEIQKAMREAQKVLQDLKFGSDRI
jgi:phage terminase small subunit